jgi:hypothetical protein
LTITSPCDIISLQNKKGKRRMKLYVVNRLFNDYSTDMVPTCEGIFTTQAKAEKMVRGLVFNDATEDEKKCETTLKNEEYILIKYITLKDVTITYTIEEVNA